MAEPDTASTTRALIVQAADELFYQRGFDHTSFADIAQAVKISRGNFYYHYKTKDEILDAVIDARRAKIRAMLAHWDSESETPEQCIRSFIHILIANQALIEQYGCPVGSLCGEMAKLDHPLRGKASELFTEFRDWLRGHFIRLGRDAEADALAMHVLARSQGIAILANTFHDKDFVAYEVRQLEAWLDTLIST